MSNRSSSSETYQHTIRGCHAGGRRCGGFTLIEILVVVVILMILLYYVGSMVSGRMGSVKEGKAQSPIQRAQGTVCMSNLNQLRQGIQLLKMGNENETPPQSLAELRFPAETLQCPDGKTPYQYDTVTGQVRCTYPFHQKY
jgi:prepilin-type N-terminal cleavage/methylation domain-containing protein